MRAGLMPTSIPVLLIFSVVLCIPHTKVRPKHVDVHIPGMYNVCYAVYTGFRYTLTVLLCFACLWVTEHKQLPVGKVNLRTPVLCPIYT